MTSQDLYSQAVFLFAHLSVGSIDEPVECNSAQRLAKAVDTMQRCTQEAQQAQLFPPLQPVVQPGWETLVFGALPELQPRSKQAWEVYKCQGHQGYRWQALIHQIEGETVERIMSLCKKWQQNSPQKTIAIEEEKEEEGDNNRATPRWE